MTARDKKSSVVAKGVRGDARGQEEGAPSQKWYRSLARLVPENLVHGGRKGGI